MNNSTLIPDARLKAMLINKDLKAFSIVYDAFSAPLYGVIRKMVKNPPLADLVLQRSFEKIWQQTANLHSYRGRIFVWMHNITRDVAIEELNRATWKEAVEVPFDDAAAYEA